MSRTLLFGTVSAIGIATSAAADVPKVATDIAPVHSLVAMVMGDLGSPDLLVQPGASPHGYSMRPSEAQALEAANLVFWIGEGLEPWLEGPLEALASDAQVVELIGVEGVTELEVREGATFEKHSHDDDEHHDDEDHAEEHGHDDHDDRREETHAEAHEDHDDHDHDDHAHEEAHEEDHHHNGGHDPHAWLDPENARVWLGVIAAELSELDPENAETYSANAAAGQQLIDASINDVMASLQPVRGKAFVVFHDAYQYFENRFDFPAAGSIRVGDSSDPSPARIQEIHDKVQELGITCAFSEPQFNASMIDTVFRGSEATVGVLDPLGADLEPGADLYPQLIRNLGSNLAECLGAS
ncbi:zinc ABC transporter substrate-binding protein [Sagittula stellata]|uniref:High-affinity zinc uptake system protein ZnuA n=1 Tax=Sagittula stellata (strain ATCC 700073 / DSM 11524 / E-37) TaxID=388399 RepID=A3K4R3_SAGS3|nr:zinc ABC transporter substrate-binding protein [Sagittula stellata]EBA07962.1 periplasmic solute binding protein [Sagittula stellata E-37]